MMNWLKFVILKWIMFNYCRYQFAIQYEFTAFGDFVLDALVTLTKIQYKNPNAPVSETQK